MKLGLGTVQFGQTYGVSNVSGRAQPSEVKKILATAKNAEIQILDTAAAYGESEKIIGQNINPKDYFKIVTKIPSIKDYSSRPEKQVQAFFQNSLNNLQQETVYGLLMHRASDLLNPFGQRIFDALEKEKAAKRVSKIGISIYAEDDIDALFSKFHFDLIQAPVNIFDQRLIHSGVIEECSKRGIEVHIRSVFLQGLLLMDYGKIPEFFTPILPVIARFHSLCELKGWKLIEAAYRFIKSVQSVEIVLVGINDDLQLQENIQIWNKISDNQEFGFFNEFQITDKNFLNPSLWKLS